MENFNPELYHKEYFKSHRPSLTFDEHADYLEWKDKVKKLPTLFACRIR